MFAKQGSKIGEVTMNPDSDSDVKVRWSDGTLSGYVKVADLSQASVADQREAASWCKSGVKAKDSSGRIGTLTMAADSDAEVKLKWADDGSTSRYIKAVRVHPISESAEIAVGDKVRVKASVTEPRYEWGSVKASSVGTVVAVDCDCGAGCCTIDFPEQSGWRGVLSEMELVQ